ncbi:energy-coupling factor transporter transmembrane protein EcfT [Dictyobacter kobayashii]|uniref:Energy-coupling factor transporter transmembrane protein EcfT n=1 Tax=Dictyobacter kobayashii TaxID=2014872 RepID=A0A402ATF4_9CHLR|nr:energy-coupling factor transporter transmembrane component T [Dictyobacter kobayashii]GCE22374.1 energy-coupling factor transporter transmembrane protein EcfT [Dictyobacter kobayashii]
MIPWLHNFFFHTLAGQTILGYVLMFVVPLSLPVLFITLIGAKGLRHLFSYEPRPSFVHRLDPRIKVLYPFIIGILSVLLNWNFVYALLLFTVIPWILVRPSATRVRVVLTLVFTPAIGLIWSQGMFYITSHSNAHLFFVFPPTLSWLGTPGLSTDGLLYGVQQAGRVIVALSASLILLLTTTPAEIIWAFYKFRMPAAVGLAFTVALRFLPQLIERTTVLLQVLQLRGYDLSRPRWWEVAAWPGYITRVVIAIPTITVPLLIGSLRSTSVTAMVVDARAFGTKRERTSLHQYRLTTDDYYAIGVLALVILLTLALILLHIANRQA